MGGESLFLSKSCAGFSLGIVIIENAPLRDIARHSDGRFKESG
jgi:hypothetical protein